MNNELKIRAYETDDRDKLVGILTLNVPRYFAEEEVEDFKHYLDHEIERYFLAIWDDKIVGSGGINFENNHKTGIISWDFINPDFQQKGVGSKLLAHRIELLKSIVSVENIVVRTSQHAYKFYEKRGFILNEVQTNFWAKGFDMYKMTFKLKKSS